MNKIILITGATSGIGLATTKQLLSEGHTVYASGRSDAAKEKIKEAGGIPVHIEMTDEETMKQAVDQIIQKEGRIDVLFNNAGYGLYGPVEEVPLEKARHQFEVNLFGLSRLTQLVLPHMRKQGSGTILNTSSVGGKIYFPLGAWYHATKHALEGWSDCLRLELEPLGINVVIIEPGLIKTQFSSRMQHEMEELGSTGAYDELLNAMASVGPGANMGSDPQVIADVVSQAIRTKRPRTRYHAGQLAGTVLFFRRWLSDRLFDKFIMFQTNKIIKDLKK